MYMTFKNRVFMLVLSVTLVTSALTAADRIEKDVAAIARVKAGELTEAKAVWWGFDPLDSTAALQSAISSGARRVIVQNVGRPWFVTPLRIGSDVEIVFEKGVVVAAKKGEFQGRSESLISITAQKNVTLIGDGATLRMQRSDYDAPPYTKSEWRHLIAVRSSENVRIEGLILTESGGDGIYLGTAERGVTNRNIVIKNVVCDANYRQGISVITAENLLIEDTVLKNTEGTAPQAGIDFEPNTASECLVNCVMRNCLSENNAGSGYTFYLPNLTEQSSPVSVRLENCTSKGSNRQAFAFSSAKSGVGVGGTAEFVACDFRDGNGPAVVISRKPAAGCQLKFVDCHLANPGPNQPVIRFETRQGNTEDVGGIVFENCRVEEVGNQPLFQYVDREGDLRLVNVTGNLRVRQDSRWIDYPLTTEWLDKLDTGRRFKRFARYDMQGVQFEPIETSATAADQNRSPFRLRRTGTIIVFARRNDKVQLELSSLQVGRYSGQAMSVVAVSPSGKKNELGSLSFLKTDVFEFNASETGLYRIPIDAGANKVQIGQCSHPMSVSGETGRIRLIGTTGSFYFCVPRGTKEFGVKIGGEGGQEAVGAALVDPSGSCVWKRPTITVPEQYVGTSMNTEVDEVWQLRLTRPVGKVLEDFTIQLQGVPPFLANAPQSVVRPTR